MRILSPILLIFCVKTTGKRYTCDFESLFLNKIRISVRSTIDRPSPAEKIEGENEEKFPDRCGFRRKGVPCNP